MVDRITPRTTDDDRARLRAETGVDDPLPVVTEPFAEWVLAGEFPHGRPRWEDAGARFVDDVVPWEQRKLRLLNGSHSLMAYAGTIRGHDTVAQAIADPVVRGWVDEWWDDAARHLPLPADGDRGVPGGAAGALREPADPPPAGPDRRRRLAEAADPDPADASGPTSRRGASRRAPSACSPRGCATCAGTARRWPTWRRTSSSRSPPGTSTTPSGGVLGRLGVDDARLRAAVDRAGPRAGAVTVLRPQESADPRPTLARRALALPRRPGRGGAGAASGSPTPLADAIDMPVPASYNDIVPGRALHDHVGEVWYQTRVRVPHTWGDQRIVLRFDSATHRATVWVDGHEVVRHEGGYTPFEADVTDLVRAGAEVLVTAAVDNVLTWETIPPGIVVDTPRGRRQKYMHDFFNYAGLHRPVWLYATPHTYLDGLRVTTDVDDPLAEQVAATVGYRAEIAGDARR